MISHSGKIIKDGYNFIKNKHLYKKYLDKIIFIPLSKDTFIGTGDTAGTFWYNENFQRQSLFTEIQKFPDDTLVAISDVDEIWDPNNLDSILYINFGFNLFFIILIVIGNFVQNIQNKR